MSDPISQEKYKSLFTMDKASEAIKHALDIRKHEIDLYWKRASYFWTFIGAAFAGYFAIQSSSIANKTIFSIILSCLGLVFSFGWFCANKGSKFWQENWENHVDMLEDEVTGPLYKITLSRPKPAGIREWIRNIITGPRGFSTSKINQIISLFVTVLWLILIIKSLPFFKFPALINWGYIFIIVLAFVTCIGIYFWGRTYNDDYQHIAYKRNTSIVLPDTVGKNDKCNLELKAEENVQISEGSSL
jgi:hypothetical protein